MVKNFFCFLCFLILNFNFIDNLLYSQTIAKQNLGPNINSICDEVSPVISPDGRTFYFTRADCEGGFGGEDIWVSYIKEDGSWSKAENIGEPLNDESNNCVYSVSPDGNRLLVSFSKKENGKTQEDGVALTYRIKDGWSKPEPLKIDNFYNFNKFHGFCLSNDGKILLMTIERFDIIGKKDIYISFIKNDGNWTEPKNIGEDVNTKGDEMSPFLASDQVTLYFSSDGRGGYGSADIFYSRRLDNSWSKWSKPVNMGKSVNTPDWDAHYKLSAKSDFAYFVSNKETFGKSDIFKVSIPDSAKPFIVALIKGKITSFKTYATIGVVAELTSAEDNQIIASTTTNPANGDYAFTLPVGKKYFLNFFSKKYKSVNSGVDLSNILKYTEITRNIELMSIEDSIYAMRNILYKKNSYKPNPETILAIKKLIEFLKTNENCDVNILGHADSVGSELVNMLVSEQRAIEARRFFVAGGIDSNRIHSIALGESSPIVPNDTEERRALNRRVEFTVFERKVILQTNP